MNKLADVLATISVAEEAITSHVPSSCEACAEAFASSSYLVCGEHRDWAEYLSQLLDEARTLTAKFMSEDSSQFNEDEEDLLRVAAPMLDSYRRVMQHNCPECRGGTWCPAFVEIRSRAQVATLPVQRVGARILARMTP